MRGCRVQPQLDASKYTLDFCDRLLREAGDSIVDEFYVSVRKGCWDAERFDSRNRENIARAKALSKLGYPINHIVTTLRLTDRKFSRARDTVKRWLAA